MSRLLNRGRVHPNVEAPDDHDSDDHLDAEPYHHDDLCSVTSAVSSMTHTELITSVHDQLKRQSCEEYFRGSTITTTGKFSQLFKILFIVMVPVVILTGITGNTFVGTFRNYFKSSQIRDTLMYSVELGRVIHYLQEERDISALYLSSIEEKTKSLVLMRYAETDQSLEQLTFWTTGPNLNRPEFESKGKFLNYLNKHRYEVDILQQSVTMELELYTTLIRVFISWLYDAVMEDQSGTIWRSLVAYQEVVIAKEYMGLERALGTIFYAAGKFSSVDVYLWFLESQDVTNATFLSARRYSDLVHNLYEKNFNGDELLLGILANMRAEIRRNDLDGQGSIKVAQWWFNNMTVYMDLLLVTQTELAVQITEMLDELQDTNMKKMSAISVMFGCVFVLSFLIIYAVYSLTNEIQNFSIVLSERSRALNKEKKRTEILLYKMLPKSVANILKQGHVVEPQTFAGATIFFSDIEGFTKLCSRSSPVQVIQMLNSMYSCFDDVIAKYDVYKVETIGDAYMVVSGIPKKNGILHAFEICSMALKLIERNNHIVIPHLPGSIFKLRIGIHTGPVVAAVVGVKMPRYCLFGETVTVAQKMEAVGIAGKIQISESTFEALEGCESIVKEERFDEDVMREIEEMAVMKGKARTFWISRRDIPGETASQDTSIEIDDSDDDDDFNPVID